MYRLRNTTSFYLLTSLLLTMLVSELMAQQSGSIAGRVTDATTGKPIAFASVYINLSTRGTTSDSTGRFSINNIPLGSIEIVATAIGYKATRQPLRLIDQRHNPLSLTLQPEAKELNSVIVTAKRSKAYDRQLRQFQRELLGDVSFANRCTISNLTKVQLRQEDGQLRASISEPLIIENNALGYRLYYDLGHFNTFRRTTYYSGTSRFEEMQPQTPEQQRTWNANRQRAYQGSFRHLLTSLLAGTYEKEGFLIYKAAFNVPADPAIPLLQFVGPQPGTAAKADSLFWPGELPQERELRSTSPLEILYTRRVSMYSPYRTLPYAYTLLLLPKGYATVTTNGWVSQPMGLELRGNMSDNRLASLLPADWNPGSDYATKQGDTTNTGKIVKPDARLDSLTRSILDQQQSAAPSIFLHVAKSFYLTGDLLWFSGYVLDPFTHKLAEPRTESQGEAIHIELLSSTNQRVEHQWIQMKEGRLAGSFQLSDTLATGTYRLLAYITDGIRRDKPGFERTVTIVNPSTPPSTLAMLTTGDQPADDSLDVQLLPEGGRWVRGIPSRVGIKVIDKHGRGRSLTGQVVSAEDGKASPFTTNKMGMGSLELTPMRNQTYYYQTKAGAARQTLRLPSVDSVGFTLAADLVADSTWLAVRIRASPQWDGRLVYLTIQSQGQLVQQTKLQLQMGKAEVGLSTARCVPGITRITLSDDKGRPYAERLVFVSERPNPIEAVYTTDQTHYAPRQMINLGLRLTDSTGAPILLSGSAAVIDADQLPADSDGPTLRTHLLLSGDLHGRIEQPEFYLKDNTQQTRRAIDDLMLTQGWRRLSNLGVMASQESMRTMGLTGRILTRRGKPVPNVNLLFHFMARDTSLFARSARTNADGRFVVSDLQLVDTVRVRLRIMDDQFRPISAHAVFDSPGLHFDAPLYRETIGVEKLTEFKAKAQLRLSASMGRLLQEVVVRATRPDNDSTARRISIHGTPDATIKPGPKAGSYTNVFEMIANRVPGVQVNRKDAGQSAYSVQIRGASSFNSGGDEPLYMLDGTYITNSTLLMIDPGTIDRIEVLKNAGAAIYGARGATGVIALYSKKWNDRMSTVASKRESDMVILGYSVQRQFYVPRYEPGGTDDKKEVDRRDILYWQPLLSTDSQGQISLSFPKSDVVRRIWVVVQGISLEGRAIYSNKLLNVNSIN